MKKVVCILLALMMLLAAVPTLAEEVDLSQYTDAQLQQGLDKAEEALEQVKDLIEKMLFLSKPQTVDGYKKETGLSLHNIINHKLPIRDNPIGQMIHNRRPPR